MLTDRERERYGRQLPLLGDEGQNRLARAHVLVAGAGGLGTPVGIYLAAAGVGTLTLVDRERVERSNLNRQILHWERDIGREKVVSAAEKLRALNPDIRICPIAAQIDRQSIGALLEGVDVLIDATDNFDTRYLLNEFALARRIPFVFGAVQGMYGEVSTILPGQSACLSCLFPEPPPDEPPPVLGITAGVIGLIQAGEAIKLITGQGDLLADRLLVWDGQSGQTRLMDMARDPACRACGPNAGRPG